MGHVWFFRNFSPTLSLLYRLYDSVGKKGVEKPGGAPPVPGTRGEFFYLPGERTLPRSSPAGKKNFEKKKSKISGDGERREKSSAPRGKCGLKCF